MRCATRKKYMFRIRHYQISTFGAAQILSSGRSDAFLVRATVGGGAQISRFILDTAHLILEMGDEPQMSRLQLELPEQSPVAEFGAENGTPPATEGNCEMDSLTASAVSMRGAGNTLFALAWLLSMYVSKQPSLHTPICNSLLIILQRQVGGRHCPRPPMLCRCLHLLAHFRNQAIKTDISCDPARVTAYYP